MCKHAPTMKPLLLGLLLLLVSLAAAQRGAPGEGILRAEGPLLATQPLAALRNAQIQDELKMTPDQRDAVETISAKFAKDLRARIDRARRNPFTANREKLRKEGEAMLGRATDEALAKLEEDQRRRLKEVSLQIGGSLASANPLLASDLDLDSKQEERVDAEIRRLRRAEGPRPTPEAVRQAQSRIDAILKEDQRRILKASAGKPFHLSDERLSRTE